jgi:hypothetical protein
MFFGQNYWNWHLFYRWSVLILACSLAVSYVFGKKIHWTVGLLTLSVTCSSLLNLYISPDISLQSIYVAAAQKKIGGVDIFTLKTVDIQRHVAFAMMSYLLLVFFVGWCTGRHTARTLRWVGILGLCNACIILIQRAMVPVNPLAWGGLMGNPSMSACFVGALLPLFPGYWSIPIGVVAILITKTSMALGVACVSLMAWFIISGGAWVVALLAVSGLFSVGWMMQGQELFSSTGRFQVWELAYRWWTVQDAHWFGVGPGVAPSVMATIQSVSSIAPNDIFMWLHNEPLQLLFEQGIFGLLSGILVVTFSLWSSRHRPRLFAAICGFIAMSFGNYPTKLPSLALTFAVLVAISFQESKVSLARSQNRV